MVWKNRWLCDSSVQHSLAVCDSSVDETAQPHCGVWRIKEMTTTQQHPTLKQHSYCTTTQHTAARTSHTAVTQQHTAAHAVKTQHTAPTSAQQHKATARPDPQPAQHTHRLLVRIVPDLQTSQPRDPEWLQLKHPWTALPSISAPLLRQPSQPPRNSVNPVNSKSIETQ